MKLRQNDLLAVVGYYLLQTVLALVVALLFEGWFYIVWTDGAVTTQGFIDALYAFVMRTGNIQLIIANTLTLLVVLIIARRNGKGFFAHTGLDMKMSRPSVGVLCVIAGAAANFWFSCVLNSGLVPDNMLNNYQESSAILETGPLWASLVTVIIAAPLVEEIIFRGQIFKHLRNILPAGAAIVIQGLLFGGAHGDFLWIAYATVLGWIIGLIRDRTGSLRATILFHIAFNASGYLFAAVATVLFEESWGMAALLVVSAAVFLTAFFAIDRTSKKAC